MQRLREFSGDLFSYCEGQVVYFCKGGEILFEYALPKPEIISLVESKSQANQYESEIRFAAQQLWNGDISDTIFTFRMFTITRKGLNNAFERGMRDVGILPEEIQPGERLEFGEWLTAEQEHIIPFATFISYNSRANGGKWGTINNRVKLWGNRFQDIRSRAKTFGGMDTKLEWLLGETEKNCKSCSRLNGKVKRASYWAENEIYPQNPPNEKLECGGWNCDCDLNPTDKPLTRGRMPNLP